MSLASFVKRRSAAARSDAGFTLIEIMAALTVFGIVASMSVMMLLASIRGGYVAKSDTVGRNLTQAKVEDLRNLPFHIDQAVSTQYDLLDLYYPNRSGTGAAVGTTGYVPSTVTSSTYRSTTLGDPATGAFFRTVINPVPGYPLYKQYVDVQFVASDGTALSPLSTWAALTAGSDTPLTNHVAVSVTTLWKVGATDKNYNMYTRIASGRTLSPKVNVEGHLSGLSITGSFPGGTQGVFEISSLDYNASLSNIVTAASTALAARAKVDNGTPVTGALTSASAPPNTGPLTGSQTGQSLGYGTGSFAAFGSTTNSNVSAGSASGQPYAGTSAAPLTTSLLSNGNGSAAATYTNQPSDSHLGLTSSSSVVSVEDATGGSTAVGGTAYGVSTVSGLTHAADSKITGLTTTVLDLFPTAQAPNGVAQIQIQSATLRCLISGTIGSTPAATAALTYTARFRVAHYDATSKTAVFDNSWTTLSQTNSNDKLNEGSVLSTQVGLDALNQPILLSDYIGSWSSITSDKLSGGIHTASDKTSVGADYPALISINSKQLRTDDPTSVVGITLGAMSCLAEDHR